MFMKTIIDRFNRLSQRDRKTLSQKGLKAGEEVGELCKAILPMESAHGANHRLPSRDKVIEECADVMLVAYSIANGLGVSWDEMIRVMDRKADYWEFLLDNEDQVDVQNLDFEIHITVREPVLDQFINDCAVLGVKPILLDLIRNDDEILDIMTSSRFHGSTTDVMRHSRDLANNLRELGHDVVREKIETIPNHPMAHHPDSTRYFEAHLAFRGDRSEIEKFTRKNDIHLSRNKMKKGPDSVLMGTYRKSAGEISSGDFGQHISDLCQMAKNMGLDVTKPHTEYSLYDDNQKHDGEWIAMESKS